MLWFLCVTGLLLLLLLAGSYVAYRLVFAVGPRHTKKLLPLPRGDNYELLRQKADQLYITAEKLPYKEVFVQSHDGLRLYGRLYETDPQAPVQILFHGYRSTALHDLCGGMQLALQSGCNALLVDQRAHEKSQGRCLSFGILERQDCLAWIRWAQKQYGAQHPIILTGISMGAATVLMAAELELPPCVRGIIADSGYTSPRDIICQVMRERGYPHFPVYGLVRLGGRLFGGFDVEQGSAEEALRAAKVPVLFIHGEGDRFVPCAMSVQNHAACQSEKYLLTIPGAGHGLGFLVDQAAYRQSVTTFLQRIL